MAIEEMKQQSSEKNPRYLKGNRPLREDDIILGDEICEMEDHRLNFYLECWFDADRVFGTNVCTAENDDYLNIYADYDMARGVVCDTLVITLWREFDSIDYEYKLSGEEKVLLQNKMDAYCKVRTGMSLAELSAKRFAYEQTEVQPGDTQPKREEKKRQAER